MTQDAPEKDYALESPRTRRDRKKLQEHIEATKKKITLQALERKSIEIHQWIARHAHDRVVLPRKGIPLFDENQNTAELSKSVSELAKSLINL